MEKKFFNVNVKKYNANRDYELNKVASLNKPANNAVMFCTQEHLAESISLNNVNHCLVFWPDGEEIPAELAEKHVFVYAENPRQAYAMFFVDNDITYLPKPCEYKVVDEAYIAKDAQIGEGTVIFPGAYIGDEVVTGKNCYIDTGVKLLGRVILGDNVVIRANTVVGADGLTTMRRPDGSSATIPQFGGVVLEDKVQIGANTVIARGAIDDTVIHTDSKVDSCCFISHNVQIGAHSFIVGETIMFGSSSTGEQTYISGNSTIREGHHVGSKALVGMGSVVVKNVPDGTVVKGNPAK